MDRMPYYLEYLMEEGFRPKRDESGNIVFKAEGKTLVLFNHDDDPEFFRLSAYGIWEIESEEEYLAAMAVCNSLTVRFKAAKLGITDDRAVVASIELILPTHELIASVFTRALYLLQSAVTEFGENMRHPAETITPVAEA